jgi:hypothetical protein
MYRIAGTYSAAPTSPAPAEPRVQPSRGPPPGSPQPPEGGGAAPAKAILKLGEDRERIALGLNEVVVRRLFSAGLDLQAVLGMMGADPMSGKICHAVNELDQAIRDIRDAIFDHPAVRDYPGSTSTSTD